MSKRPFVPPTEAECLETGNRLRRLEHQLKAAIRDARTAERERDELAARLAEATADLARLRPAWAEGVYLHELPVRVMSIDED